MRPRPVEQHGEALLGLLLAATGVAIAWSGSSLPSGSGGIPGPAIFPVALGVLLALVGTGLAITVLRGQGKPGVDLFEPRAIACIALIGAYAAAFEPLGFLPSTLPFLFLAFVTVGRIRWPAALGVSLVASLIMAFVFLGLLSVNLPDGPLG